MKAEDPLVAHLRELFAPAGAFSARRMFGGHGVYVDGVMCAVVMDGRVFLKVDDATRAHFEAAGCRPFVYTGQMTPIEMSYWSVPEAALDSADDMAPWLRRAIEAAGRKPVAKPKVSRRKPA